MHTRSVASRWVIGAFLAGALISAPLAATAGTATSAESAYSVGGRGYNNQAKIVTNTTGSAGAGTALAYTSVSTQTGSVPAGYMGARARMFNSSGTLLQQSGITYNSANNVSYMSVNTYRSGHGVRQSWGVTWGWNGSSYGAFYTFKSPFQNS